MPAKLIYWLRLIKESITKMQKIRESSPSLSKCNGPL